MIKTTFEISFFSQATSNCESLMSA